MRKEFTIINKWAWLCLDKTSFRKTGNGLGLGCRLWFLYAGSLPNDGACRGLDWVNLLVETMPSSAAIFVFSPFSIANFNNFITSNIFPRLSLTLTLLTAHSSVQSLSCVWLFETSWTVAPQAPLSMEFFRQECWNELLFPPPGNLPYPGSEPESPVSLGLAGGLLTTLPPDLCLWSPLVLL